MNATEERARQRHIGPGQQQMPYRAEGQRTDRDAANAVGERHPHQIEEQLAPLAGPSSNEHGDPLVPKPSDRKAERTGRRGVEPMDVVDRDEHRGVGCELAQARQQRGGDDATALRYR